MGMDGEKGRGRVRGWAIKEGELVFEIGVGVVVWRGVVRRWCEEALEVAERCRSGTFA